ncbi:MAG: vanadium-dependent haloperoxidase [Chloroflexi bacterium]|nr:MAG: vanadium-dependent haloperoxidase [Chloroflexota bacterium]
MRAKVAIRVLSAVLALGGALAAPGSMVAQAGGGTNVVIQWNRTMLTVLTGAATPPAAAIRLGAIVQAAVFDAVNGIEPRYTSIHVAPAAPEGASRSAAAVGAAYTALVMLFPAQKTALDAALAASIADLKGRDGVVSGLAWGDTVATQVVTWRSGDGFNASPPPYTQGGNPGDWQPTPGPTTGPPRFRTLASTTPFALTSPSQFAMPGPRALSSAQYAADFNEVKAFGSATSTARTATQTETAKLWQLDNPTGIWDRVADSLAESHHLNLIRTARLLALVDAAETDAVIAVFNAKNQYNFWRPVTAIAQAASDGNPDTSTEAGWLPLLPTPYFQEYPSAHSGVSSAATGVLASFFGEHASFTVISSGLPGVERSFTSFSDAIAQVADARVWAGFHFRSSCNDAAVLGLHVASQAESTLMQPLGDGED